MIFYFWTAEKTVVDTLPMRNWHLHKMFLMMYNLEIVDTLPMRNWHYYLQFFSFPFPPCTIVDTLPMRNWHSPRTISHTCSIASLRRYLTYEELTQHLLLLFLQLVLVDTLPMRNWHICVCTYSSVRLSFQL